MVLFSAKRNMVKKIISFFLVSLFITSALFSTTGISEAQTNEYYNPATGENVRTSDYTDSYYNPATGDYTSTTNTQNGSEAGSVNQKESLNSSNESMATTLGNSGCTALGGAIGNTLSSLGQQLISGAGISGLGSSASGAISEALGGGQIGSSVGNAVGSIVDKAANTAVTGATSAINQGINQAVSGVDSSAGGLSGAIQAGTSAIVGGADKLVTSALSSDLLSGATNAVSNVLIDLGGTIGSGSLVSLGNTLGGMSAGYTAGELGSMFGGASAIPGVGSILSLIGGSGPVPTDPQTIVKQINTLQQDTSILKTKETCLNRLSYTSSLITRAKMENNIRNWLNTGNNGNPLYVTNMNDYLLKQTQNQTKLFLSDLSKSNSPYKNEAIKNIVSGEQAKNTTNSASALNDSLPNIIGSANAVRYRNGDSSAGGWKAWNASTQIDPNNRFGFYLDAERIYQEDQAKKAEEAKNKLVNGVSPIEECVEVDATSGACRKSKVVTPASVIEEKLRSAATAPERNAGNIGADSNETISTADLALQNYLTDSNSSFWNITDDNATAREISSQELNSSNEVIGSIEKTANSLVAYVTIVDELRSVTSEAAVATDSLIKLGPVTYCPSNLANQSNSGVASLFDRATLYGQAITSLDSEIETAARTMIDLYALKNSVTQEGVDYQSAAGELINISTSGRVPSSDVVTNASSQLSQARTIRDTTKSMITSCEAEHKEILAEEERKKQNLPTTY